jgi:hypothetical protein
MRVYSVHVRGDDAIVVREGFAWAALPLPFLWAAFHRMWFWGLLVLALDAAVAGMWVLGWLGPWEAAMIVAALCFLFAAEAHDLYRRTLYWRGYVEEALTTGRSADGALRRWADRRSGWDSAFA